MHLSQLKKLHSHYVPQARFAGNRQSVFNLTQTEQGYGVFKKFSEVPAFDWSERVFVGRGVEIGKRGITVCCEICGSHRSAPVVREAVRCRLCAAVIQGDSPRHAIISTESGGPEWYPLIVGEDVDRYSASCRRFIKMGVPGIRYKPIDHFAAKKLLIRKTGVGLRTAVDESGSATVQTVFYVVTYSEPDGWLLDYLQGVINSRPILAWYLKWSGENQWRSHPYVTPRVVKELPIADPFADDYVSSICREIATEARRVRRGEAGADYRVDDLVFRLYGLDGVGASWISDALADTDDSLEYFVRMKTSAANGRASEAAPGSSR
ncbi:MAG: hypothetical protein OXU21_05070 [Chloroflexota bacterium]|nr:hypothetical protein [Chloroflexota bacterium]